MNDHNLDDLIIGEPEPGSKNSKTLLTIIALLIVILIVGLIVWALLFGSSDAPSASNTVQNPAQSQPRSLDPNLSPLDPVNTNMPAMTPDPTPAVPQIQLSESQPEPESKPLIHVSSAVAPAPQETSKPKPTQMPKPTQTPKPVHASSPATPSAPQGGELIKNADKTIYYIQVGAFKRNPSPRFMKKLKKGGFTFITKTTKGVRRVRVGPYDTYEEAKTALPIVKEKLGIDGLIVKF
jgi:cell division septation protein DedD